MNKQDDTTTTDDLSKIPNAKYAKLFEQFKEIDTLPLDQWKTPHVLGYICRKFKETFGVDYVFKFNSPLPSRSFEIWQVKALSGKLSSQPKILKAYIDWAYTEKAKNAKRKPTSISFLTQDEFTNQYKWQVLNTQPAALNRTSSLPQEYIDIIQQCGLDGYNFAPIRNYGDLALFHAVWSGNTDTDNRLIQIGDKVFAALTDLGFDTMMLNRIT